MSHFWQKFTNTFMQKWSHTQIYNTRVDIQEFIFNFKLLRPIFSWSILWRPILASSENLTVFTLCLIYVACALHNLINEHIIYNIFNMCFMSDVFGRIRIFQPGDMYRVEIPSMQMHYLLYEQLGSNCIFDSVWIGAGRQQLFHLGQPILEFFRLSMGITATTPNG